MSDETPYHLSFSGVVCQRFGSVAERYEQEDNRVLRRRFKTTPACWRDKSATFTVLPNQGERHPVHLSLNSWRPG